MSLNDDRQFSSEKRKELQDLILIAVNDIKNLSNWLSIPLLDRRHVDYLSTTLLLTIEHLKYEDYFHTLDHSFPSISQTDIDSLSITINLFVSELEDLKNTFQ